MKNGIMKSFALLTVKSRTNAFDEVEKPIAFAIGFSTEAFIADSNRLHQRILKSAGLGHIRLHDLRHTFATVALQNGVDIKTVSSMLCHFDAGFTLRTYTHVTTKMQEQAADTMGQFIAGSLYCMLGSR